MRLIQRLYNSGARKFLLFDIPSLGCTPSSRFLGYSIANGECLDIANELAKEYNAGLKQLLKRKKQTLQGAIILQLHAYNLLLSVIENGQSYGT